MPLTEQHRKQIAAWYCVIFYVLMVFKWFNGLFLYQIQPTLFNTRLDFVTWLVMQTGLHQWLLNNPTGWLIFDVLFYSMPLVFFIAFTHNRRAASIAAIGMLLINWIYIHCFTLYPSNSIESYIAWLLFPVLFITANLKSFYYLLQGLRYFFLFFFASAGIWKFVQKGIFNLQQMSGVLLYQHKDYLASSPGYWYSNFIYWFINHPLLSYALYFLATVLELSFIIGFFTKKYDKWLIAALILFLLFDVLLMRINYTEITPLLLTLLFSKYTFPKNSYRR